MAAKEDKWFEYLPLLVASAVTPVLYFPQAQMLLFKIGEALTGVFDTSVPAFPLAGMMFAVIFLGFRWRELRARLSDPHRDLAVSATGAAMALVPLLVVALLGSATHTYSFAGIALVTCWVGVAIAVRPSLLALLLPYLAIYLAAVGSVGVLTTAFGDPLAVVVAAMSQWITSLLHVPVHWSSVYMSFVTPAGATVELYVSQECSGIASVAIFLQLIALMHLDIKPAVRTTVAFAAGGAALFMFLNSLRVVALVVAGVYEGTGLLWNLHGWVGYVLYIFGYSAIVFLYMKAKKGETLRAGAPGRRLRP